MKIPNQSEFVRFPFWRLGLLVGVIEYFSFQHFQFLLELGRAMLNYCESKSAVFKTFLLLPSSGIFGVK
jgi:hypothetical protein